MPGLGLGLSPVLPKLFLSGIPLPPAPSYTKLYGMNISGGTNSSGTLYEYIIGSNTLNVLKHFDTTPATVSGKQPQGIVKAPNNKIYGFTQTGGANNIGVIYEYDISGVAFAKKIDMVSATTGSQPFGGMSKDPNITNKLYGSIRIGGTNNAGTIFEYDYTTNTFTKKIDLATATGAQPLGSMVYFNNKFYAATSIGGANNFGVIFEYDHINGIYTKKIDFTGTTGSFMGSSNQTSMCLATNNKLYGVTQTGGTNNLGVIYEYDPSTNSYVVLFNFTTGVGGSGTGAQAKLVQASNGKLYGFCRIGGANNNGTLFEYDINTSTFTVKVNNLQTGAGNKGGLPFSGMIESNSKLYASIQTGGTNNVGGICEYDFINNIYTLKFSFASATTGGSGAQSCDFIGV